ncbi:hypothetical protein FRC00_002590 [Tulasnella sp. 408]|nr:hypothetical protein FRC00_002590 [Tulasnella sp. 408]
MIRRLTQLLGNSGQVFSKIIIDSGTLPTIIDMLSSEDADLASESAWIVANVSAGGFKLTSAMVKGGAIPKLLTVFQSSPNETKLSALMAFQNILAGSTDVRESLIREGGLEPALDVLEAPEQYSARFIEIAASMISGVSECTDPPQTTRIMPVLLKFIRDHPNDNAKPLSQVIKVLNSFISNAVVAKVVIESGVIPRLIRLSQCEAENNDVQENALWLLNLVIAGQPNHLQVALDNGLLDALQFCLGLRVRVRLALWAVGHINYGTVTQVTALAQSPLMPLIVDIAIDEAVAYDLRNEAVKALSYTAETASSNPQLLEPLLEARCIETFVELLPLADRIVGDYLLWGIDCFIRTEWTGQAEAMERFKASDGIRRLRDVRLKHWAHRDVGEEIAQRILKTYFPDFSKYPRV